MTPQGAGALAWTAVALYVAWIVIRSKPRAPRMPSPRRSAEWYRTFGNDFAGVTKWDVVAYRKQINSARAAGEYGEAAWETFTQWLVRTGMGRKAPTRWLRFLDWIKSWRQRW